jgi:hypothetical protein
MGVKLLNTFLKEKFGKCIIEKSWINYKNKKIAVDVNNYIYKFLAEDNLINGFKYMFNIFLKNNIHPLFIFDGKAPKEKIKEIEERKKTRKIITKKLENIKTFISRKKMIEYKRKIVKVTRIETDKVKELIYKYGFNYMDAPNESDILCCKLVQIGKVHACLSEDMDMFIYGCSIVLRLYSNTNIIYEYNLENILNAMNIDLKNFKYLSILANNKQKNKNIFYFYNIYSNFTNNNIPGNFIDYIKNLYIINDQQYDNLINIYNNYNLKNSDVLSKCNYILIKNRNSSNKLSGRSRSIVCRCSFS